VAVLDTVVGFALAAYIFFGIWEWNERNEMDTWLLFSI